MDVKANLNAVFQRVFDNNKIMIFDEMTANDVEEWDSLAHINLIMEIEAEFNLRFTVNDIVGLKNVGDMIQLIEKKLAARASS
jgi:acyl carrier protein